MLPDMSVRNSFPGPPSMRELAAVGGEDRDIRRVRLGADGAVRCLASVGSQVTRQDSS